MRQHRCREQTGIGRAGLPMAKVATGMPAGIWAIDNRESMPLRALLCTGTPSTGKSGFGGQHAGKMRRAAGTGDDHPQAARSCACSA